MLHIGHSGRVDAGAVARTLRLLRSTSPSSLLIASLDAARRQLSLHGEQLLHEALEAIEVARSKLETIPGIAMVDSSLVGHMGVAGYDPMRIVLDVRGTGRTGYEIADGLRRSYDVHVELPQQATIVFIVGLSDSAAALRRLAGDVDEVVKRLSEPGATAPIVPPAASLFNEVALPPREAFLGEAEQVAVEDAVGRISCESIASYPPGVPALLPGERISAETVAYLRRLAASGARLHGASDPAFRTINVLVERA
jgi:arginine/lysine/ornithine decarboxylase